MIPAGPPRLGEHEGRQIGRLSVASGSWLIRAPSGLRNAMVTAAAERCRRHERASQGPGMNDGLLGG